MKKIFAFGFLILVFLNQTAAQQFIDKAVIEYEVKTSVKKTMGGGMWSEMMKDNMSDFKLGYFNFSFAGNKSVFKFDRWAESSKIPEWFRKSDEENIWYFDHNTNKFNMQKNVGGSNFNIEDSIPAIEWRLSNESRVIAGYNCRKAVGKIMDSVYVFAFYTDEILIPGGPCSINGLPGMILGVTIPRMYTSWIATRVSIDKVDEQKILPVTAKKNYTTASFKKLINDRSSEWFTDDDEDSKKYKEQFFWSISL